MDRVPREEFVPKRLRGIAYRDSALPIGHDQTISQPYIVALMTQLAQPRSEHRALDVGVWFGVIKRGGLGRNWFARSIALEIIAPLAQAARDRLERLGYHNVHVFCADGSIGLEEHAPYDVIIAAAAPREIPQPLIDQLARGGRLVIPVGVTSQALTVVEKDSRGNVEASTVESVAFVPMTGNAGVALINAAPGQILHLHPTQGTTERAACGLATWIPAEAIMDQLSPETSIPGGRVR